MFPPKSVEEWLALPEVDVPKIDDPHKQQGLVLRVAAVGFVRASVADVAKAGLAVTVQFPDRAVALPTVNVGTREEPALRRLPAGLAQWAFDVVAIAFSSGQKVFPADVEFCELKGRMTADIR